MPESKVGLFIPTLNAEKVLPDTLAIIDAADDLLYRKLVIDSESTDGTRELVKAHGFEVDTISKQVFTHGKVRHWASDKLADCDFIIMMTQDVKLTTNAIRNLIRFIERYPNMLVAYGRQRVDMHKGSIFEYKARLFNYPEASLVKTKSDIPELGIMTAFSSDAFSIYRQTKLRALGNFPDNINFAEDNYMAATGILKGLEVGYCADAEVLHTHHYTVSGEYHRYIAIGKFHRQNPWIQASFGRNESAGVRSVFSEYGFLIKKGYWYLIPYSTIRFGAKFLGYKRGQH
ncbi:glycosyltransferase family 2 protein [Lactiplantibacillus fabifermentans]|uniref:Glycosyltransferase 2-like domain-containing protein n=1 Tax=Lactiplantibacillus fabifermentans DSM 21115 TaxID=1413187 RepID=A0A0R2NPK1_9LACO|nr:glycosyltransferase [Lactiplantibacillus fabifermentans]KRO27631.1 hypothetical protein DY78_GL003049 [Lactiplantibacillus fabifermentans DSM 21115]